MVLVTGATGTNGTEIGKRLATNKLQMLSRRALVQWQK